MSHSTYLTHVPKREEMFEILNERLRGKTPGMIRDDRMSYRQWDEVTEQVPYLCSKRASHAWVMKTTFEIFIKKVLRMNRITLFDFQDYTHICKTIRKTKLYNHLVSRVFIRTDGILYRSVLRRARQTITIKRVTFEKRLSPSVCRPVDKNQSARRK